ncbi:MAG TPA: hypothetical protein VEG84_07410 [Thermoanaerobaculia bacterium]|nr:hypothetical protein [Thermoanaerobaculia bacterium]
MTNESKELPTDPLADASTGVVRRSRGAFLKTVPAPKRERRDASRQSNYLGPERRSEATPGEGQEERHTKRLFGYPRWLVIAVAIYLAALALAMLLIFTY